MNGLPRHTGSEDLFTRQTARLAIVHVLSLSLSLLFSFLPYLSFLFLFYLLSLYIFKGRFKDV